MGIEEITTSVNDLDVLDNKYRHANYTANHDFPELTAVCPVTRLPDFYDMTVEYEPDEKLIELKSFKMYLNSFRDKEIIHEEIINEIFEKLIHTLKPRWLKIILKVRVRGGIETTIKREWEKTKGDILERNK